ncbi:MAG: DUF4124 domain-containing protein, partial [Pseudomonadota bacterium]
MAASDSGFLRRRLLAQILRGGAVLLLCGSGIASAEIYRSVAPDGTVSFSDQPAPNAEPVELPEPAVAADAGSAQAEADARVAAQLEVAQRLAADRRERAAVRAAALEQRARIAE